VIKRLFLAREQKIRWKNVFFIGYEVLFYETAFSASALEHVSANHDTTEAADWVDADREADYRRLSPLLRKTSDLEGEEVYSVLYRLVSRNLCDR
jgi:hypothetical protein